MTILPGYKSYIVSGLIVLIGLLSTAGIIDAIAAESIIVTLLGLLGISLREAIGKSK